METKKETEETKTKQVSGNGEPCCEPTGTRVLRQQSKSHVMLVDFDYELVGLVRHTYQGSSDS